jgi:lipoate-protein ligase A
VECLDYDAESPELNLALDEALLLEAEEGKRGESLRFWTFSLPFVVLGHSRRAHLEADLQACADEGIPVLRRASGGGTVLQLPGCLNYSLVLAIAHKESLSTIAGTTQAVMRTHAAVCARLTGEDVRWEGESDLVLRGKKFSGNAQRRLVRHILFHGTFLLHADLSAISRYLRHPEQEPPYRQGRPHSDFLTNCHLEPERLKEALAEAWGAAGRPKVAAPRVAAPRVAAPQATPPTAVPLERARTLVMERYGVREWQFRR